MISMLHNRFYKIFRNFPCWCDCQTYPTWDMVKQYLTCSVSSHLELLLYCLNKCKRHRIMYYRMVIAVFLVICIWEYWHVLMARKNIKCINTGSEYYLYTPHFVTCAHIDLYIWTFTNMFSFRQFETFLDCCNFIFYQCTCGKISVWTQWTAVHNKSIKLIKYWFYTLNEHHSSRYEILIFTVCEN